MKNSSTDSSGAQTPGCDHHSLVALIRHQARVRPEHVALIFLPDGELEVGRITYAELDRRARAFAARVQADGLSGQCVLLMLPSSIYYVVAFVGCLYAGAIPVPGYPPTNSMHAERMAQIVMDCDAKSVILTTSAQYDSIHTKLGHFLPQGLKCKVLSIDELSTLDERDWVEPELTPDNLAYLQYTSGSTSQSRGVMVTHRNLLAHCRHLQAGCQQDHTDVCVTWLPLFHDMGLISGVIQPLYLGATTVLLPAMAFLQKPLRWLSAISRYRGTASFAPNFAYELCAATLDQAQIKTLDLSSWTIAMNGAEPVRASTIQKFRERFAPCGFRSEALNPGYGLAEATLTVTCNDKLVAPPIYEVDADALEQNRFVLADSSQGRTRTLVGCGKSRLGIRVAIVEPETGHACDDGRVGEIWVHGPIVAAGYWRRPEQTTSIFHAYLSDGDGPFEGPFLRTGDLGVQHEGQLYVTGRIKDLLIVRGRNHYPQDIEQTVFHAHPAAEIGHGAAFSVEDGDEEKLVIVQEIRRSWRKRFNGDEVVQAIRAAIAAQHGLQTHAILLVNPASVPLTSSGKIQRQSCRQDYLQNQFDPLFAWKDQEQTRSRTSAGGISTDGIKSAKEQCQAIAAWLTDRIAQRTSTSSWQIGKDVSFTHFGFDSMALVSLSGELSSWLNQPVEPTLLYNFPSIDRLARHLSGLDAAPSHIDRRQRRAEAAETIAIIGMACRFPGASSTDAYWRLLAAGDDAITEIPASRWRVDAYYQAGQTAPHKMNTRWGGFVDGVDEFDAHFFGIAPREADSMDPQQRLLLQTAWHALEDAGISPDTLGGSNTGVFIGVSTNDYRDLLRTNGEGTGAYAGTGNAFSIVANRLSYIFDLHGPSWAVDTACSSSLVALHQARRNLLDGDCKLAIAGGVNLILSPENSIVFSQAQMMSADGRCKTFDAEANGYVRSEGCGVVILKRYADAVRDNDRILGLIAGSAVNQDGKSNGLTAPNGLAQQAVMRQALAAAGLAAADISYVEAHGTGTRLGDPIEISAIKAVYGAASDTAEKLWVGSVKTNIGHLEAAAGMAGLIKVVLAMRHCQIPAHLHLQHLNPGISFADTRCDIPSAPQDWQEGARPRAAGVSSFGFGGANAHVIVQEAPVLKRRARTSRPQSEAAGGSWQILVLSAKRESALKQLAQAYAGLLAQPMQDAPSFAALCRSAGAHRAHHSHRIALLARSSSEAVNLLQQYRRAEEHDDVIAGTAVQGAVNELSGKVALLFTGQGSQYACMGSRLYETHAGFRRTLDQCDAILRQSQGWSLLSVLYGPDGADADLTQTLYAQPALFALEYALARLWQSAGLRPDYLIGHSLGEYVAACIAGVFSLEDGLKLVAHRGRLMQNHTAPGGMVAVRAPAGFIAEVLSASKKKYKHVAIAAHNSPEELVLSGAPDHLAAMAAHLAENGAIITRLQATRGFHSPLMRGMIEEFERCAQEVSWHSPTIPVVSNVTGELAGSDMATPAYWVKHVLATVQFSTGLKTLVDCGCRVFVEIGPHPVLTGFGRQFVPDAIWLPSLRRGHDDDYRLQRSVGEFHVAGGTVDWAQLAQDRLGAEEPPQHLPLPLYPFVRDRYWFKEDGEDGAGARRALEAHNQHPLAGRPLRVVGLANRYFENVLSAQMPWFTEQHRMAGKPVLPAAAIVEWALAALSLSTATSQTQWVLRDMELKRMLAFDAEQPVQVQLVIESQGDAGVYSIACFSRGEEGMELEWHEHATLTASRTTVAATAPARVSIADLKSGLSLQPAWACYERFERMGMSYGPAFQGVLQLWSSATHALASIAVPEMARDGNAYFLHPIVLDACLHPLLFFIDAAADTTVLPFGIGQVNAYRRLPAKLWCHVVWHGEQTAGVYLADVRLYDESGECLASLRSVQLLQVARAALEATPVPAGPDSYAIEWTPLAADAEAAASETETGAGAHWLIFSPDVRQAQTWQSAFVQQGHAAIAVSHGTGFAWQDESSIRISAECEQNFASLFAMLKVKQTPIRGLVFLSGAGNDDDDAGERVEDAVFGLACKSFLMLQHFLAAYADRCPDIILCTKGAHALQQDRHAGAILRQGALAQSALHGMAKAVIAEYPRIKCVQVDLDPRAEALPIPQLLERVQRLNGSGHLAWRDAQCYEARLQRRPTLPNQAEVSVRSDASYLITGGLSGLGLAVAQWLAERGAGHLVLVARTNAAQAASSIQAMEQAGAQVTVLQADVADAAELARVIRHIDNNLPPLRGVVHAAGMVDDCMLAQLDWPRFAKVMESKVRGAWRLHRLTEHTPLDFFALFSSLASLVGSPGQASYIVANAFLDSLAHYRRQHGLRAISLNWGPWAETGMAVRRNVLERLAQSGIDGIETCHGLEAFAAALGADTAQIGIAHIDWAQYGATLLPDMPYTLLSDMVGVAALAPDAPATTLHDVAALAPDDAKERILDDLFKRTVRALRLDAAHQAEMHSAFRYLRLNTLGLDSLMAVELRNRLLADLAVDVPVQHFISGSTAGNVVDVIYGQLLVKQLTATDTQTASQDAETEVEVWTI